MELDAGGYRVRLEPARAGSLADPLIPGSWMVAKLAASFCAVALLLYHAGLALAPENPGFVTACAAMSGLAAARFLTREPRSLLQEQVRDFSENALLFCLICLLGVIASYPIAAGSTGFVDATLERIDTALHFDWVVWYRAVAVYPWLQHAGAAAYAAIFVSPFLILGWMAWERRRCEARVFLLTFWVATVLTLALFWCFPAEGPLAFLWQGDIPYMPTSALYQGELIPALRVHEMTHVDLGALRGLVCAPSFHTVSAVLYIVAAWPIARLRWIVLAVNFAMLLATPIEGTHYLTDMIAGLAVAGVAVLGVRMALRLPSLRTP